MHPSLADMNTRLFITNLESHRTASLPLPSPSPTISKNDMPSLEASSSDYSLPLVSPEEPIDAPPNPWQAILEPLRALIRSSTDPNAAVMALLVCNLERHVGNMERVIACCKADTERRRDIANRRTDNLKRAVELLEEDHRLDAQTPWDSVKHL